MHRNRTRTATRFAALALIGVLVVGCSSTETESPLFEDGRDLASALLEAVTTSRDAAGGFADPGAAPQAITRASSASGRLATTAAQVDSVTERNLGLEMAIVADQVVALLGQGDVRAAERVRMRNFVPVASELSKMQRTTAPDGSSSGLFAGRNIAIAVAVFVVAGTGLLIARGSKRTRTSPGGTDEHDGPPSAANRPTDRTWDTPHPLYSTGEPDVSASQDEGETYRTAKIRTLEVELHELLASTLEQIEDRGWDVSLVCPKVYVSGDPIRIQRAVLAFLGNAYLAGAQRVGIVIDDTEDGVRLSIGHDAPFEDADAEDVTSRLVGQLGQAVGNEDLDWSLIRDEDVYLATVSLGHALAVDRKPVESGA